MSSERVFLDPGFSLAVFRECDLECSSRLAEDDELAVDGEDDEFFRWVFHFAGLRADGQ